MNLSNCLYNIITNAFELILNMVYKNTRKFKFKFKIYFIRKTIELHIVSEKKKMAMPTRKKLTGDDLQRFTFLAKFAIPEVKCSARIASSRINCNKQLHSS